MDFLINIITSLFIYIFLLLLLIIVGLKIYESFNKRLCTCKTRLDGKVVLITGGNSGIGLETARDLAGRGARVIIASRDEKKSADAVADITAKTGYKNVHHRYLDLAKFSSVRKFAEDFNKEFDKLDILINNSGVAGLKHGFTEDGINTVMQINHFGPFLLTNLLLNKLVHSKPSRIIIVSSLAHVFAKFDVEDIKGVKKIHSIRTYANSKLCNLLWAKALARQVPEGVTVNVLHPGVVQTDIWNRMQPLARKIALFLIGNIFKTMKEGAQTTIHLAVSENLADKTGGYYAECERSRESALARNQELIDEVWSKSLLITQTS